MAAILKQELPDLPETVPEFLRQIVAHCLEKDASERFQSARDLRFALWQVGTPSGSHSTLAASTSPGTTWVWRTVVALVLIAAAVAGTRWLWRDATLPPWSGVLLGGPEMALNPRLSPDGNLLAFKPFDNGQTQVAVEVVNLTPQAFHVPPRSVQSFLIARMQLRLEPPSWTSQ